MSNEEIKTPEIPIENIEAETEEIENNVIDGSGFGKSVIQKDIDVVMSESMIPYSEHVILERALPRVEDGLKPVQRRILYTLHELDITPDKDYKKSARIVGECLGKFHPHGDTSVYDAMVRMAQDFNMREVLVDGHGNYGSVDGDGAAAMRYTEARMAPLAIEVLKDLDKNTVDWTLNFDDTLQEPVTLPCRFPNILVNGANGIAIGLATNIPTHNLGEVISGAIAMIDNRDITLEEMMKIIPGPDFPTGGYIIGGDELKAAYETGKGKIGIRAKVHIEGKKGEKQNIVITELPYQVNKAKLLQRILEVRDSKKYDLSCITEILDESDRSGMRAVVRLKKDSDVNKVLEILFKETDMQISYGINMVAIADGRPQLMGILDIMSYYINYQRDVIYRRTKYELDIAKEREHILLGLIVAVRNIDEVVKIIKTSEDTAEAKRRLMERFNLSDRQAQAILDMRLARLTSLEIYKLEQELKEVQALIAKLTAILNSRQLQFDIIKSEMLEIKKKFKNPRKSVVIENVEKFKVADSESLLQKSNQNIIVSLSANGFIKAMLPSTVSGSSKLWTDKSRLAEAHISLLKTKSSSNILVFTNIGNVFKIDANGLAISKWKEKGIEFAKLVRGEKPNEKPIAIFEEDAENKDANLLFFTKEGLIKKTSLSEYSLAKSSYQAIKLKEGDEVLSIEIDKPDTSMLFVTKNGMGLNASKADVPIQGRISGGVKGIALADGDEVVSVNQVSPGQNVCLISNKAYAKQINTSEIEVIARYRKGVKVFDLKGDNSSGTSVVCSGVFGDDDEVIIQTEFEEYAAISIKTIAEDTRSGKGKSLSVEDNKSIIYAVIRKNN
ncbi:MAG: DNA topoisomerase 4 subunit A [Clostridia bacterium]|nr:DNA topoisomerase 4 subunit A [Clostridia bacterium]